LRELFRAVIDKNIAARPTELALERKRVRGRGRAYRPPEVLVTTRDAVILYAESATLSGENGRLHNEPLVIGAARLEGGAVTRRTWLLKTSSAPREKLLAHIGVSAADVAAGMSREDVKRELLEFAGALPLFAWTASSPEVLEAIGVDSKVELLKGRYCDYRRAIARITKATEPTQWGGLEEVIAKESLEDFSGESARAYRRLLQTEAVFGFLCAIARAAATERATASLEGTP
jgi:hypothetical protein